MIDEKRVPKGRPIAYTEFVICSGIAPFGVAPVVFGVAAIGGSDQIGTFPDSWPKIPGPYGIAGGWG